MTQENAEAAPAPQTDDAAAASPLSSDAAAASPETSEAAEAPQSESSAPADDASTEGAEAPGEEPAQDSAEELDAWKQHARKHERRAEKAEKSLRQLQEQVANQDTEIVEYQQTVAREKLATQLARAGMAEQDAATLIEHIDPMRLLSDGAPSSEAITQVARSLSTSAQRGDADADQGRRSDVDGLSADQWIRSRARSR